MSIHEDRLPIWMRTEPGTRKPRFTREKLAATALAIADAEGFEAVSMRRIAAKLGSGTMTIYHYVRTKEDLVALMDDALMGEILVPDGELPADWREALMMIAKRTRAIFTRHPWALLSTRGTLPGPNAMRHFEQCLLALSGSSLTRAGKLELLGMVDDFVFGHALRTSESTTKHDPAAIKAFTEFGRRKIRSGDFPQTAAMFGDDVSRAAEAELAALAGGTSRFEKGLAALLDGVTPPKRSKTQRSRR